MRAGVVVEGKLDRSLGGTRLLAACRHRHLADRVVERVVVGRAGGLGVEVDREGGALDVILGLHDDEDLAVKLGEHGDGGVVGALNLLDVGDDGRRVVAAGGEVVS